MIFPSERYQPEEKYLANASDINSNAKFLICIIEYENDTTLEIKEEIIEGQEIVAGPTYDKKYDINLHSAHISEANIYGGRNKLPTREKRKVPESKLEKHHKREKQFLYFLFGKCIDITEGVNYTASQKKKRLDRGKHLLSEVSGIAESGSMVRLTPSGQNQGQVKVKMRKKLWNQRVPLLQDVFGVGQQSTSSSTKNFKTDSKKSTARKDSELHTVRPSGHFLGFETVFVKPESETHSLICEGNPLDVKSMATKTSSSNSDDKTSTYIIEYDPDTSLDIKEEIIEVQETIAGQKCDEKYETKLRVTDVCDAKKKLLTREKQTIQKSKLENKYTCKKCARTYKRKALLNRHQKFECNVIPQFGCDLCDKRFKRNVHLRQHIVRVHDKTNIKALQRKYNCNKCSRSYSSSDSLTFHIRLEHAAVKPQFICDICGYKTKRKPSLSRHILAQHLGFAKSKYSQQSTSSSPKNSDDKSLTCMIEYEHATTLEIKEELVEGQETVAGQKRDEKYETKLHALHIRQADICGAKKKLPTRKKQKVQESQIEKNYKCEKCARSYENKSRLIRHKKFECDILPKFKCDFCDKRFKLYPNLQRHIFQVHQQTNFEPPQKKYDCDKCSRSYKWSSDLNRHKRLDHEGVKRQFICAYCSWKSKQKAHLSQHIISKHLNIL
ncbi:GDNF-inducible zinc finger protein 1-like [Belonocnema kinseyi]|uniref:GDNF-inducible zinc finger protein 1-like n=1 Tax=Belonocnema kinseyi TaxID=2817044 RepID=UPI00143DFEA8|nr:GDNF-inducible zinc finger protein 1-like [Belonocnema kinseyi]